MLVLLSVDFLYSFFLGNMFSNVYAIPSGNIYGEELTGLPFNPLNVDVDSVGRIYVGTSSQGLWRSDDRGTTWVQVYSTSEVVDSLYVDSRDYVYVQIGGKVYRSRDQGSTWARSYDASLQGQWWMWDEDSHGYIYANNYDVLANDYIYRSIDQGATFSVWYNVSASPNPVRHIHSVDVAPNDYVFVTTGDSDKGQIDDNTIRRWNGTTWEILAQSTASNDQEPRAISIWFMNGYAYTAWDMASYVYRFPISGTWAQREKIISTGPVGTTEMYDTIVIDGMVFGSTDAGYIFASWDSIHWVKLFQVSSGTIARMSSRKTFPLYFVDKTNQRLYRLNIVTKEDLIQQFYKTYNSVKGAITDADTYSLEQRIYNGTNYLDLTNVALSNVQAAIKGLSRKNELTNAGFEFGNATGWTISSYGGTLSAQTDDKTEGSWSFKVVKSSSNIGASSIYQQFSMPRNGYLIVRWSAKSNATISATGLGTTSPLSLNLYNVTSSSSVATVFYGSKTTWNDYTYVRFFSANNDWTVRVRFYFGKQDLTTWFDASLALIPQVDYQNFNGDNLIAYNPSFFNSTYFLGTYNTINPSLIIAGQPVSHSGTLTNGSSSTTQNLSGILTGAVKVEANIAGSGQSILKLNGTRFFQEDSTILQGRKDNVYYGRYYGVFSPTAITPDLVVVTSLVSNITYLSYKSYTLALTVSSPSGTTSTALIYVGDRSKPVEVNGTTSWNYNGTNKILTLNVANTLSSTVIKIRWRAIVGDVNGDGTVDIADYAVVSAHWYPGPPIGPLGYDLIADLNNDGAVNIVDVAIINANWGRTA